MSGFQVASRGWQTWLLSAAIALAGCQGEQGPAGPAGADGADGADGLPGVSTGIVKGTVKAVADKSPIAGVTVTTDQLGFSATTDATGAYAFANPLPAGIYVLTFKATNATTLTKTVSVLAGQTSTVDVELAYTPITITMPAPDVATSGGWKLFRPVGFGQPATVTATVTGATASATYKWTLVSGPNDISAALAADTGATADFTTCTLGECVVGGMLGKYPFEIPAQKGLVAVTAGQTASFTYNLKLTVTDGAFTQSATIGVPVAMWTAGAKTAPVGVPVYANAGGEAVAADGWLLSFAGAGTSSATLKLPNDRNPWFIPDVPGTYTLKNGAADTAPIVVNASYWYGPTFTNVSGTYTLSCAGCHPADLKTRISDRYKGWQNSAHGNQFWKYMSYDATGALVWTDANVAAPTALADASGKTIYWTGWANPTRMTVVEYGLSNGEGAHYGESCTQCHSVGQNPLVSNGGFDDDPAYKWSDYTAKLHDKDLPGFPLTAPDPTAWNLVPSNSKARAGIQCENCHGPISGHATSGTPLTISYDSEVCGVCHDRPANHDRYALWTMGGHANHELARAEGSGSCSQCHTAQGFVQWANQGFKLGPTITGPKAGEEPQPITCVACHDPHSTQLRIDETKPLLTEAGFTVEGAGPGQLCVTCHQGRRGLRNDSVARTDFRAPHQGPQADLFYGQNYYFFGALDGSNLAAHAYVLEGACVSCHMEAGLANEHLAGLTPRGTNHSFKVSENVCAKCHEGGSFETLKTYTEGRLAKIDAAALTKLNAVIAAGSGYQFLANNPADDLIATTATVLTNTMLPDSLKLGDIHGQLGLFLHYSAGVTVTLKSRNAGGTTTEAPVVVNDVEFQLASLKDTATAPANLFTANSNFVKGAWNYVMLEADRSFGAHNPSWTVDILSATAKNIGL